MFDWLKSKKTPKRSSLPEVKMLDVNGQPLAEGDMVDSLRYDLGRCRLIVSDEGYAYQSVETGQIVSFVRMIDAATSYQKVRKIE